MDGSPPPLLFEQTVIPSDAGDLPASRGREVSGAVPDARAR